MMVSRRGIRRDHGHKGRPCKKTKIGMWILFWIISFIYFKLLCVNTKKFNKIYF